jgi:hypothetical protein
MTGPINDHRKGNNMPQIERSRSKPAATALLLLLAILALAACGGSSKASPSSAAASSTNGRGTRFAAIRECLQRSGITLPKRTPGQGPPQGPGGPLGGGAGPRLPAGVTQAQYKAALKKCGLTAFRGGGRFNSPTMKAAFVKYAACMRENGINLPAPNTSGKGPVFNSTGLNTTSAQFQAAQTKCQPIISQARAQSRQGFGPPGAAGPPGAG